MVPNVASCTCVRVRTAQFVDREVSAASAAMRGLSAALSGRGRAAHQRQLQFRCPKVRFRHFRQRQNSPQIRPCRCYQRRKAAHRRAPQLGRSIAGGGCRRCTIPCRSACHRFRPRRQHRSSGRASRPICCQTCLRTSSSIRLRSLSPGMSIDPSLSMISSRSLAVRRSPCRPCLTTARATSRSQFSARVGHPGLGLAVAVHQRRRSGSVLNDPIQRLAPTAEVVPCLPCTRLAGIVPCLDDCEHGAEIPRLIGPYVGQ